MTASPPRRSAAAPAANAAPVAKPAPSNESARRAELLELDEELKKIIEQARTMKFSDDPLGINVKTKEKKGARKPDR